MSEERLNEIKLKYYQDGKGNIYELKTELEQIMINDIIELTGKNNKLQNIINEYRKHLIKKMNEFVSYDGDLSKIYEEEFDYLDKLKALKENK